MCDKEGQIVNLHSVNEKKAKIKVKSRKAIMSMQINWFMFILANARERKEERVVHESTKIKIGRVLV